MIDYIVFCYFFILSFYFTFQSFDYIFFGGGWKKFYVEIEISEATYRWYFNMWDWIKTYQNVSIENRRNINSKLRWIWQERFKGLGEDKTKINWGSDCVRKNQLFVMLASYKITFAKWSNYFSFKCSWKTTDENRNY